MPVKSRIWAKDSFFLDTHKKNIKLNIPHVVNKLMEPVFGANYKVKNALKLILK